jgi:two-component system, NarL family, nitrate/nitrite response regulator NarL
MAAIISDRPVRIGIVDDNDLHRGILHESLDLLPSLKVVAEAKNGVEAIAMVEYLHPDIVLMDTTMPVMDGIEATRIIRSKFSDTNVIILTLQSDRTVSDTALRAGACQLLNKYCGQEKLFQAIKRCSAGPVRIVGHPPH